MLMASQIRAARALLNWSQPKLAAAAGLSLPTIRRMESIGPARSTAGNVEAVRRALGEAGVMFVEMDEVIGGGPGVRLKT